MFENRESTTKDLVPRQNNAEVCVSVEPWLGPGVWRPATYEEIVQQQYPHSLEILDNPLIKSKRQKAVMAEIAYVVLHAEGDIKASVFNDFGIAKGEMLSHGLFYLGSAYDEAYRIVPFDSGKMHKPALLYTDRQTNYFPSNRSLYAYTFRRSEAFEAIRQQVLSGDLQCDALDAAARRMKARGNL